MIAWVRIAPIEHWCPEVRNHPNADRRLIPGSMVRIETDSMKLWNKPEDPWYNPRACSGAYWDTAERINGKILVVCEHLLEMD